MRQSREWIATSGLAVVMVLVACSWTYAQDVRTNYMPGVEFSKYRTYAWVNEVQGVPGVGGQVDQILDSQIKHAIDSQMALRAFTKAVDGNQADLLLGYQAIVSQEKQINGSAWGGGWGLGGWGPWGSDFASLSAVTSTINVGTFVLGMYDPAVKKLVWIGAAQGVIQPSKNQEKNLQRLDKGAQNLLKEFPPGRPKNR
jgi:hypothetical protein